MAPSGETPPKECLVPPWQQGERGTCCLLALHGMATPTTAVIVHRSLVPVASRLFGTVMPLDDLSCVTRAKEHMRSLGYKIVVFPDNWQTHDFLWTRALYTSVGRPFDMYAPWASTDVCAEDFVVVSGVNVPGTRVEFSMDLVDVLRKAKEVHSIDGPVALLADLVGCRKLVVHAYATDPELVPVYRHAKILRRPTTTEDNTSTR